MVRQTKRFKKGLNKKVLSAILAASMIMTSSSFAFAAPVDGSLSDDTATATEANAPSNEEAGIATLSELGVEDSAVAQAENEPIDVSKSGEWTVNLEGVDSKSYSVYYNGLAQEPEVTGITCTDGKYDSTTYTVDYFNNTDANALTPDDTSDDPYVLITLTNGKYSGTKLKVPFTINQVSLENAKVKWEDVDAFVYDGTEKYPAVVSATVEVTQNGKTVDLPLTEGVDYTVEPTGKEVIKHGLVNAGKNLQVKIAAVKESNYTSQGGYSDFYNIDRVELGDAVDKGVVTVTVDQVEYNRNLEASDIKTELVESATEKVLKRGTDYYIQVKDANGKWTSNITDEAMTIGVHDLRLVAKEASGNYVGESYYDTTYEVVASSLATAVKDAKVAKFENGKSVYTGVNQFPEDLKTVIDSESIGGLKYGLDYEITNTKEEWVNVGEYTLNLKGLNEYEGQTATVTVKITPKQLPIASVTQGTHRSGNLGSVIVTITDKIDEKTVTLEEGKDYTYEVTKEATEASPKGKVEITGIGNYTTEDDVDDVQDVSFDLKEELPLSDPSISVEYLGDYSYNGDKIELSLDDFKLVETDGNNTYELKPGDDYTFDGKTNVYVDKAGEVSVVLKGNGDYRDTREVKINIEGKSFEDTFEIEPIDDIYLDKVDDKTNDTVKKVKAAVKVVYKSSSGQYSNDKLDIKVYNADGEELADGFKLTENPGTYTVKVTPKTDEYYTGSLETTFNVFGHDLKKAGAVVADIEDQVYTSEAITPAVTVKIGEKTLVAGEDYEVTYTDNVKGGEATAIITGINNYSGTLEKNFKITRAAQGITMTNPLQERDLGNGSRNSMSKACTLKLATTMADEDTKFTYTTSDPSVATVNDGKITYQGVGECTITVSAAATDSCEAASLDIKVVVGNPGTPTFTPSVTKNTAKKAFVVTSSTVRGADGFEVQYSIRDDFWKATTKDFSGTKSKLLRQTCTTVHSNMTYYVRVRAYQVVDGEKVYSTSWSPVKTIKTK